MGRQYPIQVGKREFFIDLLFYNVKLHCYFVVELKTVEFEPEFAGKLSFYLSAVDGELKSPNDNPTIGLLLCKGKDKMVAEYALKDVNKPMGVSEYKLSNGSVNKFVFLEINGSFLVRIRILGVCETPQTV